jgi:Predicted AAA-ATPase/PD-(D/E)XK nuclease superfamily
MAERYPVGIQHFSELRRVNALYVDKTALIYELLRGENRSIFFLARPRRFGKSLLVSTLAEIFSGNKALFEGLYIYDKIEWQKFPIIQLSFVSLGIEALGLEKAIEERLAIIAAQHGLTIQRPGVALAFEELIHKLQAKYQQKVVILIDEYDSPITKGLEKGDFDLAEKHRDILKEFYSILKDNDNFIRFLFITGITKFTKVSIFSALNYLTDISLDKRFSTICGYTQAELEANFPEGIQKLADENQLTKVDCLEKVKDWYNGFSWDGEAFVYNPFSVLLLLDSSQFSNYWFETGTPTFLVSMLNEKQTYVLENIKVRASIFNTYDLRKLDSLTLLLQTGYLTIKKKLYDDYYAISFPNKEVRESFNEMLLGDYLDVHAGRTGATIYDIRDALKANDLSQVIDIIQSMFESVPFELYEKKDKDGKIKPVGENFYHAVIYLIFNLVGVKMQAEVSVKNGRVDALVETSENIYLFEFKKDQNPDVAIQQMQEKNYAGKYLTSNKNIYLVGVCFSLEKRGISDWKCNILKKV